MSSAKMSAVFTIAAKAAPSADDVNAQVRATMQRGHLALRQGNSLECGRCGASGSIVRLPDGTVGVTHTIAGRCGEGSK